MTHNTHKKNEAFCKAWDATNARWKAQVNKAKTMTHSENFALNQWLSYYPESLSYLEIIELMKNPENLWSCDTLNAWEAVENFPLDAIVEFIEDTRKAFERSIENMQKVTV